MPYDCDSPVIERPYVAGLAQKDLMQGSETMESADKRGGNMRYRIRAACLALGAAVAAFGGDRTPRVGPHAQEEIGKNIRSWSKDAAHDKAGKRPKAFAREKGNLPLPRGIWVHGQSRLGRLAEPKAKPDE